MKMLDLSLYSQPNYLSELFQCEYSVSVIHQECRHCVERLRQTNLFVFSALQGQYNPYKGVSLLLTQGHTSGTSKTENYSEGTKRCTGQTVHTAK